MPPKHNLQYGVAKDPSEQWPTYGCTHEVSDLHAEEQNKMAFGTRSVFWSRFLHLAKLLYYFEDCARADDVVSAYRGMDDAINLKNSQYA